VARSSLQPRSATPAASVRSVAQPWNSGDDFEVASSDRQAGQFLFVINRENRISVVGRRGLIGCWLITASSESTTAAARPPGYVPTHSRPAIKARGIRRSIAIRNIGDGRLEEAALMGRLGVHL
jgi:hypothetical protein